MGVKTNIARIDNIMSRGHVDRRTAQKNVLKRTYNKIHIDVPYVSHNKNIN
jgi:hypothetical protein